jgi:hypothetical protein
MARTTASMSGLTYLFMAGWLLALASPAGAVTYAKFYTGVTPGDPAYTGAYSTYSVYTATMGLNTSCPTSGSCSSDNVQSSLIYNIGSVTITATASDTNGVTDVYGDFAPRYGGLGVSPNDDQITGANGDMLTLTFSSEVILLGVGTLFDGPHDPFGSFTAATVAAAQGSGTTSFLLNGSPVTFDAANTAISVQGTVFTFATLSRNPDYYVSALRFGVCGTEISCETTITPIPGALPLFATGLGALGLLGWRRKRKASVA